MPLYGKKLRRAFLKILPPAEPRWLRQVLRSPVVMLGVVLLSLACAASGLNSRSAPQTIIIRSRLPTLTPTAVSSPLIEAVPPELSEQAAVEGVSPASQSIIENAPQAPSTLTPLDVAALSPPPAADTGGDMPSAPVAETNQTNPTPPALDLSITGGWSFSGVRLVTDQFEGDLLVYGDLVNQTGLPQKLSNINGVFYNGQNQAISGQGILDFWPIEDIPPDARVPFELTVIGLQDTAKVDLQVEARPNNAAPRQDFELFDLNTSNQPGNYCIAGKLHNPAGLLSSYLMVVAVLYNNQNQIINFGNYQQPDPTALAGNQSMNFEICVDPLDQGVARHELRAWGL